jgi:hypothetical protein
VENAISEAVTFFHLNSLSSPILVKVRPPDLCNA